MTWSAPTVERCRELAAAHAGLRAGWIPLLVRFTHEDKAAKGLRAFRDPDAPRQVPVHFTALELVQQERLVLLTGPRGSGKTSFARYLAAHLAGEVVGARDLDIAALTRDVPRNDEGRVETERWTLGPMAPVLATVPRMRTGDLPLDGLVTADEPTFMIVDAIDRARDDGPALLAALAALAGRHADLRVLVLGDADVCRGWTIPTGFKVHDLMPLPASQCGNRPANPGLNALGRALGVEGGTEAVVEAWIATARERGAAPGFLAPHLDARDLARRPLAEALDLFARDPIGAADTIRLLARRLRAGDKPIDDLLRGLVALDADTGLAGAVLAASILADEAGGRPPLAEAIAPSLLRIVEDGRLSLALREEAGRTLARWGDPRDLLALVEVPGGVFAMGSALHPNSAPAHRARVAPFRIGRYPVTNDIYRRFVQETDRRWRSVDGLQPERASAPAVDLTWRDARAFCDWLAARWRAEGRLGRGERVRLPTEPEWERAARGDRPDAPDAIVYAWQGGWAADRCNSEEAGLNDTCTVGLFPRGRSACGADDMCGQVWEWCTTLWGEDMGTPAFSYPYADDGREDPAAGPRVRRVLRGGCFSSGKEKACCTYRGSLEPDGFWRGNGFRIVVARDVN
ncbi:MAG: SUMF1/EgtB/PvdO family nonheme iron enzyme [Alphaproteobacteria bacterium]|nr:SUMF1/EgtB/PvdO family nonheme iron enzyme [Alphaproteobacteria bacterium]